ncbi:UDP-N-acetylglucosamine 2-epimerase [Pseudomonadales bacterium]|nr:UDP-N-acetylglucosamine 2-epimerase [Pseudomonadales bacterium]
MNNKKILFLTGTRADFGKIKSLIKVCEESSAVEPYIFVTGMHMSKKYGYTLEEIVNSGFSNIFTFVNHENTNHMDRTLAKTIDGLSLYISDTAVDMIVVHGDRVESLAGAIVGSLNNILVMHIEGGEVSGTIDEMIRHSVSKLSHLHLVASDDAKKRLIQLGELNESIFVIGSPDLDLMFSDELPDLKDVKDHYDVSFSDYAIAMLHPVTTEIVNAQLHAQNFVDSLLSSNENYIVIYPNNDLGSDIILSEYSRLANNPRFKVFPSIRFEYFLVFLKNSRFICGNSSAAVREAPYYGVPSINIGSRQSNRVRFESIFNTSNSKEEILCGITKACDRGSAKEITFDAFGVGESNKKFKALLDSEIFWSIQTQKFFQDMA